MIDKCLDLLQSQFGEEDEGDKESEETKERIKVVTGKIALENLREENKIDKAEKEGDNNDAEEGDGNEDYHLQEFPAPPPGNYHEKADCEEAIKQFSVENCFAIVRKRSTAGKCVQFQCDRHGRNC
ncbi:hypothetical protein MJO28_004803 [Puccinia striiformis f. sp. tritici]|uniref:Uncharacterized protein n=1 Tax=Puccinia striiformis f. sp. tritici TaxID=168172 RepID=A0ACC0EKR7_9BASI|nr:hypothetical protein MJO28_004803 [Puccinia striiformis f. sp. tritici]